MHSLLDHSKLLCNIVVGKAIVETAVHFMVLELCLFASEKGEHR